MLALQSLVRLSASLALILTLGCTLPDVAPFHAGTVELEQSFTMVGTSMTAQMKEAGFKDSTGNPLPLDPNHPASKFAAEWTPRRELLGHLTEYSRALTNIAGSADDAEANVKATMDSAQKLVSQFGGAAVSQEVSSLIVQIGGELIKIKAAKSLAEAIENLDPLITRIAELLVADLDVLRGYTQDWLRRHGKTLIRDRYPWIDDYTILRAREQTLVAYRGQMQTTRLMISSAGGTPVDDFLNTLKRNHPNDQIVIDALAAGSTQRDKADEFDRLASEELEDLRPWMEAKSEDYQAYEAELKAHAATIARQVLFLETTKDAVHAWADAHRDLRNAVKDKSRFDAEALSRVVNQVRALADKEAL
jgi:hypothetical protein